MTATIEATLADLERQRGQLDPNAAETAARAQANAIATAASGLENRINTIRSATFAINACEAKIVSEQRTLDFLTDARATIQTEADALPPRIRNGKTLGVFQNLMISLKMIDGQPIANMFGFALNNLRVGQLLKAAGFPESMRVENQVCGEIQWPGSLKDVNARLKKLHLERDEAQRRLDDALLDDAGRQRQRAAIQARNAEPQRKVRGDGSQYDKFPDGRIVEIET